jgi:hypothetical protein
MNDPETMRAEITEMKGFIREAKLLMRITTGCGTLIAGILVCAVPTMISDHQRLEDHRQVLGTIEPRVSQMFWTFFPAQARKESEGH